MRRTWETFLALRPTFALATVWLTTAGHTMTFREMNAARGWITVEGYSLHSIYLLAITLTLLADPTLVSRFGSYRAVLAGLVLLAIGAAVNGCLLHAPASVLEIGRVVAGIGAGLVIRAAPRIHSPNWTSQVAWAGILLPPAGPVVIAGAVHASGWTSWEGGFLFEGALALFALALVLSIADPLEPDSQPIQSVAYLAPLSIGVLAVWYVMHWGQLHGWLEGPDILAALVLMAVAFSSALLIVWPNVDAGAAREGIPRLLLIAYGGFVQYFNASDIGVYGGLLINFSPWMRAWLIVSLPIGAATALAVGRIVWSGRSPGYGGATFGLIVLAGGMALSHQRTLNWPFWQLLNTVDLNWFAAPQHWQLAPPRFLMGFGSAMVLLSLTTRSSRDPDRESKIRPFVEVAQFAGGTLSIGVLVTVLLVGHQVQYSYASDRGFIQPLEQADREQRLASALARAGSPTPQRQARSMLYQSVNYQADNLMFAGIYGWFCVVSLALAGCCFAVWIVELRNSYWDSNRSQRRHGFDEPVPVEPENPQGSAPRVST